MRKPPSIHGRPSSGASATATTPLVGGSVAAPRAQHSAAARACHASYHFVGDALYHSLDLIRIFFVLQSLTSRWLYQLFIELDEYDWAPDTEIQEQYLGYPIAGVALIFAIALKAANAGQQKWLAGRNVSLPEVVETSDSDNDIEAADSNVVRNTKYLGAEDYGFAVFSSSMLYMILDAVSQTGRMGKLPVGWFIATTALVPFTAFILAKTAMPDTKNVIIGGNEFPTYPTASRAEKFIDAASGAVYGSSLLVMFWTMNRELNNKTVPLEMWQAGVAAGAVFLSAISGYHMVNHPKAFHGVVTLSKGIRDASLGYAALSGLAYQVLTQIATCPHFPCWGADEAPPLTTAFTMISLVIGIFSAATSLYRYDEKHQANLDNIQRAVDAKDFAKAAPGKLSQAAKDGWQRFNTFAQSGRDADVIGLPVLDGSDGSEAGSFVSDVSDDLAVGLPVLSSSGSDSA